MFVNLGDTGKGPNIFRVHFNKRSKVASKFSKLLDIMTSQFQVKRERFDSLV